MTTETVTTTSEDGTTVTLHAHFGTSPVTPEMAALAEKSGPIPTKPPRPVLLDLDAFERFTSAPYLASIERTGDDQWRVTPLGFAAVEDADLFEAVSRARDSLNEALLDIIDADEVPATPGEMARAWAPGESIGVISISGDVPVRIAKAWPDPEDADRERAAQLGELRERGRDLLRDAVLARLRRNVPADWSRSRYDFTGLLGGDVRVCVRDIGYRTEAALMVGEDFIVGETLERECWKASRDSDEATAIVTAVAMVVDRWQTIARHADVLARYVPPREG